MLRFQRLLQAEKKGKIWFFSCMPDFSYRDMHQWIFVIKLINLRQVSAHPYTVCSKVQATWRKLNFIMTFFPPVFMRDTWLTLMLAHVRASDQMSRLAISVHFLTEWSHCCPSLYLDKEASFSLFDVIIISSRLTALTLWVNKFANLVARIKRAKPAGKQESFF